MIGHVQIERAQKTYITAFKDLGSSIPAAFRSGSSLAGQAVTARLKLAWEIARALRVSEERLLWERERGVICCGDILLDLEIDRVLNGVDQVLKDVGLRRRVEERAPIADPPVGAVSGASLRALYGYGGSDWIQTDSRFVLARIAACIAADATWAPYARGVLDAISEEQATLRVDLRSVGQAVWAWAADSRALARALYAARSDREEIMPFPAFEAAFAEVIRSHYPGSLTDSDGDTLVAEIAAELSQVCVRASAQAAVPGTTSDRHVAGPLAAVVRRRAPEWMPELDAEDADDSLARGLAEAQAGVLDGTRDPMQTARALEAAARYFRGLDSNA